MIVILLGAPGSGKGTQSKILSEKYGFTHLSTGDIFRSEMAQGTELGKKASEYVKSGKLVPDALVVDIVASKLEFNGAKFLLDGFPRNLEQAQALDGVLKKNASAISLVAYLNLPQKEVIKRLTSRRTCSGCGEVYNVDTRPPAEEGKCDKCGGQVVQREDDSETVTKKRLMVYEDLTQPLVSFYKAEQVFEEIDAAKTPAEVTAALSAVIEASKSA